MGHNGTLVIIDLLLSIFSPICLSSPLFLSLIRISIFFPFFTWYESPNLGFLVAALDLHIVAQASTLHCSSGPLCVVSLY